MEQPYSGKFYDNSGAIIDQFNIIKPYHYKPFLILSGSNYADIQSKSSLQPTKFSLATWFNTDKSYPSNIYIVNKGGLGSESPGTNMNYGIMMSSSGRLIAGFETNSGLDYFLNSQGSYNDAKWHYAVVTYDDSTIRLYVDGIPISNKAILGAVPDNTGNQPVRIGANSLSPKGFFDGYIDETRIWNRALSPTEVVEAYNNGIFSTIGLVLHLPFDN